ncbi:MAG: type I methionyl aminopeptidase [Patescibacteria group bacterium]
MTIQNDQQIKNLREGGKRLAAVLAAVRARVAPGVTTRELDALAEELIIKSGGRPSFKDYRTDGTKHAYPATLCVSVNDEIVHGIPGERALIEGDIVGLDIGMQYEGIFTDTAITVAVGKISYEQKKLIEVTRRALEIGIGVVRDGVHIGDIGAAIQEYVEGEGFGVVRELVGHGVGDKVHEDPEIPNWGERGTREVLREGMVIALEPMVTLGSPKIKVSKDGWVWSTRDGKPAAHFEHTLLVTKRGSEIITKVE